MRLVIQRVTHASVTIEETKISEIGKGLLILIGVEDADDEKDVEWLAQKTVNLRIFDDQNGVMNLSVRDIDGEVMVVSQFTLFALTAKGNRPSYIRASKPEHAVPLYEMYCKKVSDILCKDVKTGKFGADMKVDLTNDGPVTILIDSKNKE